MISKVYCIENKDNHTFEQDAMIMFETYKDFHDIENCYVVQPSEYDITNKTKEYFKNNNIDFEKVNLFNPQKDVTTNYTNVPVVLDYMRNKVTTKYMMFTDLDVVYLNKLNLPETDKCYLTILEPQQTDQFVNGKFEMNELYHKHFKNKLNYNVENITKFVNTWFIYAPTNHFFWKLYKEYTFDLLEIAKTIDDDELETRCEEIAASIIYELYSDEFININKLNNHVGFQECVHFFKEEFPCNENTALYHYNEISKFHHTVIYPINNLYNIFKIFSKYEGVQNTLKALNVSLKYIQGLK